MKYGKIECISLKQVRNQITDALNSNVAIHLNSKSPKLLMALAMMFCSAFAWGQVNPIKSIHHIEASYYTEGGYALRKVTADYRKRDVVGIKPGQLMAVAKTSIEKLPLLIDEQAFIGAFNMLIKSEYTPLVVKDEDIALCESELNADDIFHWNKPFEHISSEEYFGWVHSLVGLPVDSLHAMVWDKKFMSSFSIRAWSDLKVFYTQNDYIELCYDKRLSPFSHILEWHSIDDAEVKEWHPIDDKVLHSFYTSTNLSALDFIPSKAEMIIELFQGLPE